MIVIYSKAATQIALHLRKSSTIGWLIIYRSSDIRSAKQAVLLAGENAITISLSEALAIIAIVGMSVGCLLTGYSHDKNTSAQLKAIGGNIFYAGAACGLLFIYSSARIRR